MEYTAVGDLLHEGLLVVIKLAGPILLACMLVGIICAIFQAVTQIHEQSLAFILKLVVVFLFLMLGGGWMLTNLQDYTHHLFELIAS